MLERPKVFYNAKTKQFFVYMRVDGARYQLARVGVAVSDAVDGDHRFLRSFRPLGQEGRDIGQFIDNDGLYYAIGSALTGGKPNPNKYATAEKLAGPLSEFRDIAPPETNLGMPLQIGGGKLWLPEPRSWTIDVKTGVAQ